MIMEIHMKRRLATIALTVALTLAASEAYHVLADQPHMEAALRHLQEAKKELEMAERDKGGHRGKALELTQSAIEEVRAGIEYAEKK